MSAGRCGPGRRARSPRVDRGSSRGSGLLIDGDDLITELGATQGPILGSILDRLVEIVLDDPARNDRPTLLLLAQAMLAEDR